jgi:hypothetical protein
MRHYYIEAQRTRGQPFHSRDSLSKPATLSILKWFISSICVDFLNRYRPPRFDAGHRASEGFRPWVPQAKNPPIADRRRVEAPIDVCCLASGRICFFAFDTH